MGIVLGFVGIFLLGNITGMVLTCIMQIKR